MVAHPAVRGGDFICKIYADDGIESSGEITEGIL
jgi:hypothetical protein